MCTHINIHSVPWCRVTVYCYITCYLHEMKVHNVCTLNIYIYITLRHSAPFHFECVSIMLTVKVSTLSLICTTFACGCTIRTQCSFTFECIFIVLTLYEHSVLFIWVYLHCGNTIRTQISFTFECISIMVTLQGHSALLHLGVPPLL